MSHRILQDIGIFAFIYRTTHRHSKLSNTMKNQSKKNLKYYMIFILVLLGHTNK